MIGFKRVFGVAFLAVGLMFGSVGYADPRGRSLTESREAVAKKTGFEIEKLKTLEATLRKVESGAMVSTAEKEAAHRQIEDLKKRATDPAAVTSLNAYLREAAGVKLAGSGRDNPSDKVMAALKASTVETSADTRSEIGTRPSRPGTDVAAAPSTRSQKTSTDISTDVGHGVKTADPTILRNHIAAMAEKGVKFDQIDPAKPMSEAVAASLMHQGANNRNFDQNKHLGLISSEGQTEEGAAVGTNIIANKAASTALSPFSGVRFLKERSNDKSLSPAEQEAAKQMLKKVSEFGITESDDIKKMLTKLGVQEVDKTADLLGQLMDLQKQLDRAFVDIQAGREPGGNWLKAWSESRQLLYELNAVASKSPKLGELLKIGSLDLGVRLIVKEMFKKNGVKDAEIEDAIQCALRVATGGTTGIGSAVVPVKPGH